MSINFISMHNNNNAKNESTGSDIKERLDHAQNFRRSIIIDFPASHSNYISVGNRNKD